MFIACQNTAEITVPISTPESLPSSQPTSRPLKEINLGTIVITDETPTPKQTSSANAPIDTSVNFETPPPGKNGHTIEQITNGLVENFKINLFPGSHLVLFKPLSQDLKKPQIPKYDSTYLSNQKQVSPQKVTYLLTLKVSCFYLSPEGYFGHGDLGYSTRIEDVPPNILAELGLN